MLTARGAGAFIAGAVCLFVALASGWALLWQAAYAIGLLLAAGLVWTQLNVMGLRLRREHRAERLYVGEPFHERALLETRRGLLRFWPRLWLEIHDRSTFPGHYLDRVLSLGFAGRRGWELTSVARRRGRFTLGPVNVTSGDPFGLFRAARQVCGETSVLVYPRMHELPRYGGAGGELPGNATRGVRVQYSTPNATSVREYQPGDAFNRIHWPTTARAERLMVREFELDPSGDIWLALDLSAAAQAGAGDDSTEEVAITIAASVARHLLSQGRAVGLLSQGASLPSDRGPRQLERILQVLALAHATSPVTLEAFLPAETSRFTRSSTLVVITPSTSEQWVEACQTLGSRGVRAQAIVLEASTFGEDLGSSLLLVSSLAAAHIRTYLVKHGEPLAEALSEDRLRTGWNR